MTLHPADRLALDLALVAQPVWNRFTTAKDLGLAETELLHAGPPFRDIAHVTAPILNSACVAAVYEGLADTLDAAEAMLRAGEIRLRPAQDLNVVTPLAAVVSASMPLHGVYDAWRGKARAYAPINGGPAPALRLGLRSMDVLAHIRWLNSAVRDALQEGLDEGIALMPLAVAGLRAGDDCHGRTPAAGAALVREIEERSRRPIDPEVLEFLRRAPSLFLNLWMAATKCMMVAATAVEGASLVTASAGNGREVGIQVSGLPGRWFTCPADPPTGAFDVEVPADRALGAIGDSAVVDAFGLGAMADLARDSDRHEILTLTAGPHPYFENLPMRLGTTARAAVQLGRGPAISLGIIDHLGEMGRLGGGRYDMPVIPFAEAMTALAARG